MINETGNVQTYIQRRLLTCVLIKVESDPNTPFMLPVLK